MRTFEFKTALGEIKELEFDGIYEVTHIRQYDNETFIGRLIDYNEEIIRFDRSTQYSSRISIIDRKLISSINRKED